jgi:hypothetical protein
VGILAGSGSGKSLVLEKLHAESKNDIVLHFSLELPKSLFIRRMFVALGWVADDKIEGLSMRQVEYYARKLSTAFPHWHYTCLDTESSVMDTAKIEKMVKYYRTKYGTSKNMKVFVDYVQLLEENFDPITCRVNKYLHDIAVRNNCCIIEGMQGNDDATKYEKPAETSMIAFVKSLKNDCDIIQSFKGLNPEETPHITTLFSSTKKHRMGKMVNFLYHIDHHKTGDENWKLIACSQPAKKNDKINLEEGTNEDFDKEEE